MSLYNGLISHQQEQNYYHLIKHLVLVLEKRVLRFYQGRPCNQHKFATILTRLRHKITKIEKSKYSEPLFGDSLKDLIEELRPHCMNQFLRGGTASEISLNMNKSDISFDLSHEMMPRASKISVAHFQKSEQNRIKARKNYYSFQSIKSTPIIKEDEEWHYKSSNRTSRLKSNEFKSIKLRLQPPKIGEYIQRLKKETKLIDVVGRRQSRQDSGQPYLGQRRKKNRRVVRTIENQI